MAEASRAVNRAFVTSVGILTTGRIDFPRREHFGVLRFINEDLFRDSFFRNLFSSINDFKD